MKIEELTPENYKVPKGEERSYHCVIECVQYDSKTGKKLSVPRIQKFGAKMFESHIYSSLKKQGYDVKILHDPKQWIKEHEEEMRAKAQKMAEEKKAAEKEAFNKAVQEEVARQLASLNVATKPAGEKKGGRPKKQ